MRQTKARKALTNIFDKSRRPLTALQLLKKLKQKHIEVNKTTVYRQLESLKSSNFIKEISFGDGRQRFEIFEDHCHHHLVCDTCGKIEDIQIDENKLLGYLETQSSFQINRHSIEFFGLCINCK